MPKLNDSVKAGRLNEILDATVRSLTRHGYAGTSMRTIADEAGLTKGGLYAYIASKEVLLVAVAERYFQGQLEHLVGARSATAAAQLRAFLDRGGPDQDPAMAATQRAILDLWVFAGDLPEVRGALEERYLRYRETVADIVRRGQEAGEFRSDADPVAIAALLLAARDGLVFHRVKLALPVPVGPLTDLLCTVLLGHLEAGRAPAETPA